MTRPRPIRKLKAAFADLLDRLTLLSSTLHINNTVTNVNNALHADLLASNRATQAAVEKLVAIELHRQRSAGQREDF